MSATGNSNKCRRWLHDYLPGGPPMANSGRVCHRRHSMQRPLCTPTTASTFSGNTTGLGIGCGDSTTSASCSTANPNWVVGTRWTPISAESKGLSPAKWSSLSSATSALVLAKVKYRLQVPANTPAGTYTNLVSFIASLRRRCVEPSKKDFALDEVASGEEGSKEFYCG